MAPRKLINTESIATHTAAVVAAYKAAQAEKAAP